MEPLIHTVILSYFIHATIVLVCDAGPVYHTESLKLCEITLQKEKISKIDCIVGINEALDYRAIRNYAKKENTKFSVTINCAKGGLVALPWPMKGANIVELSVTGCTIDNFLTEMTVSTKVPDELKSLTLSDVSIEIPLRELYHLSLHPKDITRDADCGQLTLESIIFRNLHFELEVVPEDRQGHASKMLYHGGHHEEIHPNTATCIFSKLKYLEETASRVNGQYHLKLIPDHAEFPTLEVYNVSNNNLDHVPHELRQLVSKKFPLLKRIDLSNNMLSAFEFEVPVGSNKTCSVKTVDLQNNKIASLPLRTVKKLKQIGSIFIDLRQNPLKCSCRLSSLRKYLQLQYEKADSINQRKQVSDITCKRSTLKAGQRPEISLLDPNFDKNCVK